MIRFRCPDCGREYVLVDALARLPILCKGCGRQLIVPDPQPEPAAVPPPPKPPAAPPVVVPPPPEPVIALPQAEPLPELPRKSPDVAFAKTTKNPDEVFLTPGAGESVDITLDVTGPPLLVVPPEKPSPTAEPPAPSPAPTRARQLMARLVDAVVVLALAGVGAVVGEVAARKSTGEILSAAGSAPKFPPTDLLIWLGCVAVFVLAYVWLGTRGRTVGGWLGRRAP